MNLFATTLFGIALSEIAGHAAYFLIAVSFVVRDIIWLRALSVAASVGGIGYCYFGAETPLWAGIFWNSVFIGVNAYQIALILRERSEVSFSDEEQELYETLFRSFSPVEFMKFMRVGRWLDAESGKTLIIEHQPLADVMLIYNGSVSVAVDGKEVAELKDGAFLGEMSYISGKLPSATVKTLVPTRYLAWSKESLTQLLNRNPSMRATMQGIFSSDLTKKLMHADN